jgi:hypothetical protein
MALLGRVGTWVKPEADGLAVRRTKKNSGLACLGEFGFGNSLGIFDRGRFDGGEDEG